SSRLPTISRCNWSNRDGSATVSLSEMPARGPATIAFLRSVLGVRSSATSVGLAALRGAARRGRRDDGELAMARLLGRPRESPSPMLDVAQRREKSKPVVALAPARQRDLRDGAHF